MAQANRRSFLKSAALSSAALAVPAFRKDAQSPNEKFRVACMGVRGRGRRPALRVRRPEGRGSHPRLRRGHPRLRGKAQEDRGDTGETPQTGDRLSAPSGRSVHRRHRDGDPHPLARHPHHHGLPGRKARLRGKARLPQHDGGPGHGGGGAQIRPRGAGGHPVPQRPFLPTGHRLHPLRRPGQGPFRQGLGKRPQPEPGVPRGQRPSGRGRLRHVAGTWPPNAPSIHSASTATGAGSSITAAGTWATTGSIASTTPAAGWRPASMPRAKPFPSGPRR